MVVTIVRFCMMRRFCRMSIVNLKAAAWKQALHLRARFAQQLRFGGAQTDHRILEHAKQQLLAVGEKAVFVLTQLTGHICRAASSETRRWSPCAAQSSARKNTVESSVRQYPVLKRLNAILEPFSSRCKGRGR